MQPMSDAIVIINKNIVKLNHKVTVKHKHLTKRNRNTYKTLENTHTNSYLYKICMSEKKSKINEMKSTRNKHKTKNVTN